MEIYPYRFEPIFKERIWGGRKLGELFDKPLPVGVRIGESWELADLPEDKSRIAEGPLAGMTGGRDARYETAITADGTLFRC